MAREGGPEEFRSCTTSNILRIETFRIQRRTNDRFRVLVLLPIY